ncbi:transcription termination factor MTEF18, mitochondrial-like [Euphorbia lathyris]|uniref:transcription termination factor MTEF18, mitochondrial-like n=1 Tax=Euphorbia lathyris TaxID=212925 RepID=UPI003313E119
MVLPRISRRVSKLSQVIAQLNNFPVFSPVASENHFSTTNPSSISLKFRVFFSTNVVQNPKLSSSASIQSHKTNFGNHRSRSRITQAEKLLFNYLHFTRNLRFTDAEHISKNSPLFLKKLLSKIDDDEDVTRSLGKFLRYHPINEFEPFFESLGLRPSEISSLLPHHLLFLSDDHLLLENFSVLCTYGVPRSKIGKIYIEAREIFSHEFGSLHLKLDAYEKLGLSRGTVVKLAISCPSLLISDIDKDFVNVLEKLNRLGMEHDQIEEYLSSKISYNWKNVLATIDFLGKVGYSDEQLYNLFKKIPQLVLEDSGKRVYVLLSRFLKLGLDRNVVYSLIINNPDLLSAKGAKNILRALEIFEYIGMETEEIADILSSHMEVLCLCSLKGGKTVCSELKIKKDSLREIIKQNPSKFFSIASKKQLKRSEHILSQDFHRIRMERTAFLLRLGYVENSEEIMRALKQFRGRADQLQERFDCLVEAGLDSNAVSSLIKQVPMGLNQTKDVIQKKIDCLKSCFPLTSLIAFPAYLCYDIKRINHRFAMYVWLRDRGAIKRDMSLGTILASSDARFVKFFVDLHPDGPVMWKKLRSASS